MKNLREDGRSQRGKRFFASIFLLAVFGLMTRANGQQPCVITNDTEPFAIVLIGQDTNSWATITWQSCTDHVYVVLSTDSLDASQVAWSPVAWMRGADQQTAWTDQSAAGVAQRFYKIERLMELGDGDGDGIPNGWEVDNGLNPLDPADACQTSSNPWAHGLSNLQVYQNPSVLIADGYSTIGDGIPDWWKVKYGFSITDTNVAAADHDGDGVDNLTEYLQGRDPTKEAVSDTDGLVNLNVFTPLE